MSTQTSPDYLADGWDFIVDLARKNNGLDIETTTDDRNIPDQVDIRTGQAVPASNAAQTGPVSPLSGMTWKHWAGLAVAGGLTYGLVTGKFK